LPRAYLVAFSRWVYVRARFAEDVVEQAAADGAGQYVILGAGLDSFAYRRHDLLGRPAPPTSRGTPTSTSPGPSG
jgi:O-methyltransferase involved in polyketide biosynthesis